MEEKEYQRVHKVKIRKGDVVEKTAEFHESAFSLLYEKAEEMVRDIVRSQKEGGENGHLLSFMGERGSGKTTAMLSFLRALKEGKATKGGFLADCERIQFVTFDVIDASMLEDEEDLFEIILAQMLVDFLKNNDRERSWGETWGEGSRDARKELQKKFYDLLEGFRSLKRNDHRDELTSLASLKNLSFSSRLRQNFQDLVRAYILYGLDAGFGDDAYDRTYLVFAIDDLDMNIDKGFEMLGQIHRYMLVPHVIIMVTAKYEQLEILGRKYFSRMVERLDKETEDWKIEYLNRTVKEYLEKMLPSYHRLYLPAFEDGAMRYGDDLILENEKQPVKTAILGKVFSRTGVCFDGSGDEQHYLVPTSMRGLNDYYLFLDELVSLESAGSSYEMTEEERQKVKKDNLDKFQNDIVYRYAMEWLMISERQGVHGLLRKKFPQWNTYLYQYLSRIMRWFKTEGKGRIERNDRILIDMFMRGQISFGNMLWGIYWCVENAWVTKEWKNCIIALYSLELNRKMWKEQGLSKDTFGGSVIGLWTNRIFPQAVLVPDGMKRESMRFGGSVRGCRAIIDFTWKVENPPVQEGLIDWLFAYKGDVRAIEVIMLFFEAFHDNSIKNDKIRMESYVQTEGKNRSGESSSNTDEPDGSIAIVKIENGSLDFNLLGFLTNLLECEGFYRELHEAFIQSWLTFFHVENTGNPEKTIEAFRKKEGLSLYGQIEKWNKEAEGLVLPYQHTDIYVNILTELQQWSMINLSERLNASNAWELLREVVLQMEILLEQKEEFLSNMGSGYNGDLLGHFRKCPIIKCIKDYRSMGLCENFPEKFGKVFVRCCSRNDYDRLYDPESEISTSEDTSQEDIS